MPGVPPQSSKCLCPCGSSTGIRLLAIRADIAPLEHVVLPVPAAPIRIQGSPLDAKSMNSCCSLL